MTVAEAAAAALVALAVAAFGEVMIEMTSSFARAAEDCLGFPGVLGQPRQAFVPHAARTFVGWAGVPSTSAAVPGILAGMFGMVIGMLSAALGGAAGVVGIPAGGKRWHSGGYSSLRGVSHPRYTLLVASPLRACVYSPRKLETLATASFQLAILLHRILPKTSSASSPFITNCMMVSRSFELKVGAVEPALYPTRENGM